MPPMLRMEPKQTLVLVVDVQERLASAMPEGQRAQVLRATRLLVEGARLLGASVLATEQYPRGLGATVPEVREWLAAAGAPVVEKLDFSALDVAEVRARVEAGKFRHAVVVGMETHVCVVQTVRDVTALGVDVHVPIDGVASRRDDHRLAGLGLCQAAGAHQTTAETVVFDWLRRAGSEEFKAISRLVR